jgi:transcriptional pleiotropic repressor
MAKELLEKTRRLNRFLLNTGTEPITYQDIADILREILKANIFVINTKGEILGHQVLENYGGTEAEERVLHDLKLPEKQNKILMSVKEARANIKIGEFSDADELKESLSSGKIFTIVPIVGGGRRLGSLVFSRYDDSFTDDDLVLAEYSSAVVGMEMMKTRAEEAEEEVRKRTMVQLAISSLSYSELLAVNSIVDILKGDNGLLVAGKVADEVGITRSVIVNALRKLESAGVIESRSLGMKGTYINILNDKLPEELEKMREVN